MKTYLFVLLALYGAYYYVSRHYEFHDALVYAQKHPESKISAPVEYYVGMIYYQRADYPKAQEAFSALLAQHPTDYYMEKALMPLSHAADNNADWEAEKIALQKYLDDYPSGKSVLAAKNKLEMVKYHHP